MKVRSRTFQAVLQHQEEAVQPGHPDRVEAEVARLVDIHSLFDEVFVDFIVLAWPVGPLITVVEISAGFNQSTLSRSCR